MAELGIKGNTNRIKLEEHIPLSTPLHVFMDASSVCNFHCSFCPHGNGEAAKIMPQTIMPVELAKKCIDDISMFPEKLKRLSFSAVGEPLVNPNLPEIVKYARDKDVADCLNITTNASLLTREKAEQLIEAGLNHIDVSVYGIDEESYNEFSHNRVGFDIIVQQVRDCFDLMAEGEIVVKITDAVIRNKEDMDRFVDIFNPICNKICVEHAVPFWYELESETKYDGLNIYGKEVSHKDICPVPFFSMAIQANGLVTLCCIDWKNSHVLADANKDDLHSVWNGKAHMDLCRILLKEGTNGAFPCCRCKYHELVAMDNIDSYRDEILERIGG